MRKLLLLLFFFGSLSFESIAQFNTLFLAISKANGQKDYVAFSNQNSRKFCESSNVTIEITNGGDFRNIAWFKDEVLIKDSVSKQIKVNQSGRYNAIATNASDGTKFYSPYVYLEASKSLPVINFFNIQNQMFLKNEITLCNSDGVVVKTNLDVYGNQPLTYNWVRDGKEIPDPNYSSISLYHDGKYTLRAQQGSCVANSEVINFKRSSEKIKRPFLTKYSYTNLITSVGDTIKLCENLNLTLKTEDNNIINFAAKRNGDPITNLDNTILVSSDGQYSVSYKDINGCEVESSTTVIRTNNIKTGPPTIYNATDDTCIPKLVIRQNEDFMSVLLSSDIDLNNYNRQFFKNGIEVNTRPSFFSEFGQSQLEPATFQFRAFIGSCYIETEVYKHIPPTSKAMFPIDVRNQKVVNKKVEICLGNGVELGVKWYLGQAKEATLYKDGKEVDFKVFPSSVFKVTEPGKYHVQLRAGNECIQMSDTIEVVTSASRLPKLELKLENCVEKLVTTNLPNHTMLWKKNGVIEPNLNGFEIIPTTRDNYSAVYYNGFCSYETNKVNKDFSIRGAAAFCEGDSIVLSVFEANNIRWSGPKGFEGTKAREIVTKATAQNVGKYEVQFEKNGCLVKESLQVTMKTKRKGFINRSDKYCANQPITMFLDSESIYYSEKKVPDLVASENMRNSLTNIISYTPLAGVANGKHAFIHRNECTTEYATDVKVDESPDCPALRLQSTELNFCRGKNTILFDSFGKFPENEIFDLYLMEASLSGNRRMLATVSNAGKIEFEIFDNYKFLYVEGRKSGVKSNVVSPNIINYKINLNIVQTYACKNEIDLEVFNSTEMKNFKWFLDEKPFDFKDGFLKATQSGLYKVIFEDSYGCIQESKLEVDASKKITKPIVSPYPFRQSCDSVSLFGGSPYFYVDTISQYQWLLNGKEIAGATNQRTTFTKSGSYSIRKTLYGCSSISDSVDIVISELPKPIIVANYRNDLKQIFLDTVQPVYLYTTNFADYFPNSPRGPFYRNPSFAQLQWTKDGVDLNKENKYLVPLKEIGSYQLKAKVGNCVAFSDPIQVIDSLIISTTLSKNKICAGEKVKIYFENKYDYENRFFYSNQGTSIKVFKDNKYYCDFSNSLELDVPGEYFLQFEFKERTTVTSKPIKLTSVANPEPFKLLNQSVLNICSGTFDVSVSRFETEFKRGYKWFKNNEVLTNEIGRDLTIKEAGVYRAEVSLEGRCPMVSEPLTVNYNKIDFTLQQVGLLCSSGDAIIRPNIIGQLDNAFVRYSGILKLDNVEVSTNANFFYKTVTKPGTYTYTLTQGTCSAEKSITVQAIDVPRTISPNVATLTACPTTPLSFGVQAPNAKYTWTLNGNTFANNNTQNIKTNARGTFAAWIEKDGCAKQSNLVKTADEIVAPKAHLIGLDRMVKGSSAELRVVLGGEAPWTVTLIDGTKFTTSKSNYRLNVRPTKTTTYELASVQNNCGVGLVSGKAKVNVFSTADTEVTNLQVGISPNPVEDYFDLDIILQEGEQQIDYQIYNNSNQLIEAGRSDGSTQALQTKINFSSKPAGTYLLRVRVGDEVVIKRILKVH